MNLCLSGTERACPYCQADAAAGQAASNGLRTCGPCGFVFPGPSDFADDTKWKEVLALAETSTGKWAGLATDRYSIIRCLGAGGQGRIFLTYDRHLDQLCVTKVLGAPVDDCASAALARLRTEARAGASVSHPNVARVLDCDCAKGTWYFVMEYGDGVDLRRVLSGTDRLCWEQVVHIGIETANGLSAIHAASLIHRDIKPGNLMLCTDGRVKVMDLGLVKIQTAGRDPGLTEAGQLVGTPYYMSPEQFVEDCDLDHRADVYSLGATLYHLAVGRPPFRGSGLIELSGKHRHDPVVWPEELRSEIPGWFRRVVDACLAKKPDHRYQSAGALAEALHAGQQQAASAVPVPVPVPPPPRALPGGVTVLAFKNLSQRKSDDWVGDAIADCVTSRLMALRDAHVVDRQGVQQALQQSAGRDPDGSGIEQTLEAGRLVGVGTIVMGSFQVVGEKLRITAHALTVGRWESRHVTDAAGSFNELFALEDHIATAVVEMIGRELAPVNLPGAGTESLEAAEKYTRAKRALAEGSVQEAIRLAEEAHEADPRYLDPLSLIGVCHARRGEYERAAEYHRRVEDLSRALNNQPRLAETYCDLGMMYYHQGEYTLAHEFLDKAASIATELNLRCAAAKYYGNLGLVLLRLEHHDKAERAFAQTVELCSCMRTGARACERFEGTED